MLRAILKRSLLNGEKEKRVGFFLPKVSLLKILINYFTYYDLVVSENAYGTEDLVLCIQMHENSLHIDRCLRCKYVRAEPVRSKKIFFACCFLHLSSNIHFVIIFMFHGKE